MSAFSKVLEIIKKSPQYGHLIRNSANVITLRKSRLEIEKLLKGIPNE